MNSQLGDKLNDGLKEPKTFVLSLTFNSNGNTSVFYNQLCTPQWSQGGTIVWLFMDLAICPTHYFKQQ